MKHGMTLTSILVAVALSGIIAVFGGRLVVNQMFMVATASLIDRGNTIMQFYLNVLRDREVWRCTMFDTANTNFKDFVLGNGVAVTGIELRGPNCAQHDWRSHPTLTADSDRGDLLLPKNADKFIGDSIANKATSPSAGWWKIRIEVVQRGGRGDVDLVLKLCLDETKFNDNHRKRRQIPRAYKFRCGVKNQERRVRYSENAIKNDCSGRAVTGIGDRSGAGIISVDCTSSPLLLRFSANSVAEYKLAPDGLNRSSDRQAIKPIPTPSKRHPIVGINTTGELTIGTDRALVRALASNAMLCGKDNNGTGMDKVLCGFTDMGEKICCTPKGPKGPKGLKGCPPVIVKDEDNISNRICRPSIFNTDTCPGIGTNYIVTSRPPRCL